MAKIFEKGIAKSAAESVIKVANYTFAAIVALEAIRLVKDVDVPFDFQSLGFPEELVDPLRFWTFLPIVLGAMYMQDKLYWNIYQRYGRPNG